MSDYSLEIAAEQAGETSLKDYYSLLKPRVMSLVVFTGFAGFWVAPYNEIHPLLAIISMIALALGSGAAGAFNMWYERDLDTLMKRTKNRPLPRGKIDPDNALGFSIFASLAAFMMMGLSSNFVAASIMAFASFFYVVIYTIWLKPRTPQNIVIGGAAGAFPPVIGWAIATGSISSFPLILFAIIFIWTPPHFWALSLFANSDYKAANIPMMTVTAGEKSTKLQMLVYTLLLFPLTLAPSLLGYSGEIYGASAFILSGFFIFTAVMTLREKEGSHKQAKRMFGYSVFYLFALFLALIIDASI
ncbi:MAG: protoheme IX farnesyltransferase [Alphaproteobacteria bacterium]|nr:protoheme IX farnesyltransferase [Alphaproteobacteria bacterium]